MIKTFEQFDFDDPFGEDTPSHKKSYIGYDGTLEDYISEQDRQSNHLFYFLDRENMLRYRKFLIRDILRSLRKSGVDEESLEKIEKELRKTYPLIK